MVPLEVEDVIDTLLGAARDKDTVVRWSGAKGIGRMTGRLPRHLGDEVVGAVLSMFLTDGGSDDGACHGACLALAELARRGLLLPPRLPQAVPHVLSCLRYDVRRGSASVGAHVRDAACYVCWALARAYAPEVMAPYVQDLARGLIVCAAYDREVNCRRAASAAFQEHVGRQGAFPHGIDILTRADYFTVGHRGNSYTQISPYIAQFEAYRGALVEHLVERQVRHWDKQIRVLSAQTLRLLVGKEPGLFTEGVLQRLLDAALSPDLATRHGSALGVSEVVMGLKECGVALEEGLAARVVGLVPAIEKARLYRGKGGEVMRASACRVVECVARGGLGVINKDVARMMETIDDNLKHPTPEIQQAAVSALRGLAAERFELMSDKWQKAKVVDKYVSTVRSEPNPAARRGFALGLGGLQRSLLCMHLQDVIDALVHSATVVEEAADQRDPESRRNAVLGLVEAVETVGLGGCYGGE
uniref:Tubulin-folding cofactor D ARM repeats domain-containing protein n=2 Tax=Hemiselmis andersenii TaxID=464988 RepID=A0A7S1HIM2_HEMAN